MKSITVDLPSGGDVSLAQVRSANRIGAWLELTKPRIASFIVLVAAAGFYLGSPASFDFRVFAFALVGITLLSGGIAALNQYIERSAVDPGEPASDLAWRRRAVLLRRGVSARRGLSVEQHRCGVVSRTRSRAASAARFRDLSAATLHLAARGPLTSGEGHRLET